MTAKRSGGSGRPSFEEYAASQQKPSTCWLCSIPEREEIERIVTSGRGTKAAAVRYLRDVCGYPEATQNKVDGHFTNHVKRPA